MKAHWLNIPTSQVIWNKILLIWSCLKVVVVAYFKILSRNFTESTEKDQDILQNNFWFDQDLNWVFVKYKSDMLTYSLPELGILIYRKWFKIASFIPEDGDSLFLQTIGICLWVHAVLQPRRATSTHEYVTVSISVLIK